jgi:hypothetical protein
MGSRCSGTRSEYVREVGGGGFEKVEKSRQAAELLEADRLRAALAEFVDEVADRGAPVQFSAAVRVSEIVLSEWDQVEKERPIAVAKVESCDRLAWELGDGAGCSGKSGKADECQTGGVGLDVDVLDGVGKGQERVVVEGETLSDDGEGVGAEVCVGEGDGAGVRGR